MAASMVSTNVKKLRLFLSCLRRINSEQSAFSHPVISRRQFSHRNYLNLRYYIGNRQLHRLFSTWRMRATGVGATAAIALGAVAACAESIDAGEITGAAWAAQIMLICRLHCLL